MIEKKPTLDYEPSRPKRPWWVYLVFMIEVALGAIGGVILARYLLHLARV